MQRRSDRRRRHGPSPRLTRKNGPPPAFEDSFRELRTFPDYFPRDLSPSFTTTDALTTVVFSRLYPRSTAFSPDGRYAYVLAQGGWTEGHSSSGVTGAGRNVPELTDESFAVVIDSTPPVVVERSLYTNSGGVL